MKSDIAFPALLFRKGYVYLASGMFDLSVHPRSQFAKTQELARNGDWRLLDAAGRQYLVRGFEKVPPFGGVRMIGALFLCSVFAHPLLEVEEDLSFEIFRTRTIAALDSRFMHDTDSPMPELERAIFEARSYVEVFKILEGRHLF